MDQSEAELMRTFGAEPGATAERASNAAKITITVMTKYDQRGGRCAIPPCNSEDLKKFRLFEEYGNDCVFFVLGLF